MAATPTTYSAEEVRVTVGGAFIQGWGPAEFCKIEPNQPERYSHKVGAHGEYTRSKSPDRGYMVTLTLDQHSPSNGLMRAKLALGLTLPVSVSDASGRKIKFASPAGWIKTEPSVTWGATSGEMVWEIVCAVGAVAQGV